MTAAVASRIRSSRRLAFAVARVREAVDALMAGQVDPSRGLVINGFWRSGTTWVQEVAVRALVGRPVFEPFTPYARLLQPHLEHFGIRDRDLLWYEPVMPYTPPDAPADDPLCELLDRLLCGRAPLFCQVGRRRLDDVFRCRVVVKFVRGALFLPALHARFPTPILHIVRDPRATVTSCVLSKGFAGGALGDLHLADLLLEIPDGRATWFARYEDDIRELDDRDAITRAAAYWALTERYLADHLREGASRFAVVRYEDLLFEKAPVLRRALAAAGCDLTADEKDLDLQRASKTTYADRRDASAEQRAFSWKDRLSRDQQRAIEQVVERFGLEHTLLRSGHGEQLITDAR